MARLVHQLRSDDSDTQYRLLVAARKQFGQVCHSTNPSTCSLHP